MVDNYVENVHGGPLFNGRTLSLVDLRRFDDLEAALNPVVSSMGSQVAARGARSIEVASSISNASAFGGSRKDAQLPVSIDLKHLAQLMSEQTSDAEIRSALDALLAELARFVVHSAHDGSRPHANGVSIAVPDDTDARFSQHKLNETWIEFQDMYAEFRESDTAAPAIVQQSWDSGGTTATIVDEFLSRVNAIYGFVQAVEQSGGGTENLFVVVAETDAESTGKDGEYYAPRRNNYWFTVEYDPNEATAWMPASFSGRFEDEYGEFMVYTSEIDLFLDGSDEPTMARLNFFVDEDMQVFDHTIQSYQYVYSGPSDMMENTIRFDKATYQFMEGDSVRFWNYGFNLDDPAGDGWFDASGVLTFTQDPVFSYEALEFVNEGGRAADHYYALWALDLNGNGSLSLLELSGR